MAFLQRELLSNLEDMTEDNRPFCLCVLKMESIMVSVLEKKKCVVITFYLY